MKTLRRIFLVRVNARVAEKVGHPRNPRPPYVLKYAEALLKREGKWEARMLDCLVEKMPLRSLLTKTLEWEPVVLVVSATTLDSALAFEYARRMRERGKGILIVAVGQDVSSAAGKYSAPDSPFDIGLPGEAEGEMISLLNRLDEEADRGKIKEHYRRLLRKPEPLLIRDLDDLPFPLYTRRELQSYRPLYPVRIDKKVIWGHVLTSRGCPYECIFCTQVIRDSYGKQMRSRSAQNVVDELEYLMRSGANAVRFDDDNFTSSRAHVEAICDEIRRRKLRMSWVAHARVDNLSAALLKTMKEAGCVLLCCGIESGSSRMVEVLGKAGSGVEWIKKSKEVFGYSRRIGLATDALFIIGGPTETMDDIQNSIKLALELDPDMIQVHYFTPYPDTEAYRQFGERIEEEEMEKMYHYNISAVNLSGLPPDQLWEMQSVFYRRFFLRPGFIIRHLVEYAPFYVHNPGVFCKVMAVMRAL